MLPEKWNIPNLIFVVFQVHFTEFIFFFAVLKRILLKRTHNCMFLNNVSWLHYYWFYKEQKIAHLWHTNALFWIFCIKYLESFACFVRHPWSKTLNLGCGYSHCQLTLPLRHSFLVCLPFIYINIDQHTLKQFKLLVTSS